MKCPKCGVDVKNYSLTIGKAQCGHKVIDPLFKKNPAKDINKMLREE